MTQQHFSDEELRRSQKMEAVEQLAGGVAHDFNNMLTIIAGYCDLLAEDPSLTQDQLQSISQISQAGQRAASLTTQLLAFSCRQILHPTVLDLNRLVATVEPTLRTQAGEHIAVTIVPDQALGRVKADPSQLEQAIMNLVVNARDAMQDGGRLTIETSNVDLAESFQGNHGPDVRPGPYVMLVITDTGGGMDDKTKAHLFEPFFTTKPKGKGKGLGLSTVYGIIKQSGGVISVKSEAGCGTSIRIYLPRVDESVKSNGSDVLLAGATVGSETILVAEDEPGVRSLVCMALRLRGYVVVEAQDGVEALTVGSQHQGPLHLLLTDVAMPQMNGREVAERLAAQRPDLKVLFMSGYTDDALFRLGLMAPGVSFILKPFSPDALARTVRQVLDAREGRPGPISM